MTEKERMLSGRLYIADDPELAGEMARARALVRRINDSPEYPPQARQELLRQLLGSLGKNFTVNSPFRCDYGSHIHIGDNFFANYDCIIIDVCDVNIGDNVFLAPRVCIFTAAHPIDPEVRASQLEFGKPVSIGNNVWIGGGAIINHGVSIGDNVVIGSGSVVTKDIPSGVVAAGNPCRVLRQIDSRDREYWQALAEEYRRSKAEDV